MKGNALTQRLTQLMNGKLRDRQIRVDLMPDCALFLLIQLRLSQKHPANGEDDAQKCLKDIIDPLTQCIAELDPMLSSMVSGVEFNPPAGNTFSTLDPIFRCEFAKLQTLAKIAIDRLAYELKQDPAKVFKSIDSQLAKQKLKDVDIDRLCAKADAAVHKIPDIHVERKAAAAGKWIVGYFYYRQKYELNFHLVGDYAKQSTAITATKLLQMVYPDLNWECYHCIPV